jgi:hypothetical protein
MTTPQIPISAHPFPLHRVRLGAGYLAAERERNLQYLLSLDLDRLLHAFRLNAALPSNAEPLGGWESPRCELRGHFAGHVLSACALLHAATGNQDVRRKGDDLVAGLAECQAAMKTGYLSAFPEEFFDRVEASRPVWAPWYTLHKLFAGMVDVHQYCGNALALDVVMKMSAWADQRTRKLSKADVQRMLLCEFGGMPEVFANLYAITSDPAHLALARRFHHHAVMDPLARHRDHLHRLHANTQIPKVLGAARLHELTGDPDAYEASVYFWKQVTRLRCYAPGGTSNYEYWREHPGKLSRKFLGSNDHECCCTHNMLKLTRSLFSWNPDVRYADYYERAFFNGILGTQHPQTGGAFMYYLPMKSGLSRLYCEPETSYVCCSGTGIESFAKLNDSIYFHDKKGIFVNLFISSEVQWEEKGIRIQQETLFPDEAGATLTIRAPQPRAMALRLRVPSWTARGAEIRVNGKVCEKTPLPGTYYVINRKWKDGDRIDARFPMSLRLEALPNDPSMAAILYGPIVLAGALGRHNLSADVENGMGELVYRENVEAAAAVPPVLVTDETDLDAWIKPVEGEPLTFRTVGAGVPADVTLRPFFRLFGERYAVYWMILRKEEWATWREARPAVPEGVFDQVAIGNDISDYEHNFQAYISEQGCLDGRKWVRTPRMLRYDMAVPSHGCARLRVTYHGDDSGQELELAIDGTKLDVTPFANCRKGELFTEEYPLPAERLRGRDRVAVMFRVPPPKKEISTVGATTAAKKPDDRKTPRIFGCAILAG